MSIKYISLVVLSVQNSALILTMRRSRTLAGPKYNPTTAVLLSETIKTVISLVVLAFSRWKARKTSPASQSNNTTEPDTNKTLARECVDGIFELNSMIPIMIPAILYTVQNNLQYLAASNLDAATFQVLYQGKVLTTAFFAVLILRQKLTYQKWSAIFILTVGIVLVSYPSSSPPAKMARSLIADSRVIGLFAVLSACFLSGFAGVFLELLLKRAKNSTSQSGPAAFWTRNVQLGLISIVIAGVAAGYVNGPQIMHHGFLYGYNPTVWAAILLQAFGGLIVSVVIAYADNILKGFATSLSLIFSTAISTMSGDVVLSERFIIGVVLVLLATNIYGWSWEKKKPAVNEETIEVEEKEALLENETHHDQDTRGGLDEEKFVSDRSETVSIVSNGEYTEEQTLFVVDADADSTSAPIMAVKEEEKKKAVPENLLFS